MVLFVFSAIRTASSLGQPSYDGPSVKTEIPGPKSKALLKELNALQVSRYLSLPNVLNLEFTDKI